MSKGKEPAAKRKKPEDGEYISIRKTWGKPEITETEKKKRDEGETEDKEIVTKKQRTELQRPEASQGVPEPWERDLEEKIDKPDAQIGPLKREVPGPAGR